MLPGSLRSTRALWALHEVCGTLRRRLHLGSAPLTQVSGTGEWQPTVLGGPGPLFAPPADNNPFLEYVGVCFPLFFSSPLLLLQYSH